MLYAAWIIAPQAQQQPIDVAARLKTTANAFPGMEFADFVAVSTGGNHTHWTPGDRRVINTSNPTNAFVPPRTIKGYATQIDHVTAALNVRPNVTPGETLLASPMFNALPVVIIIMDSNEKNKFNKACGLVSALCVVLGDNMSLARAEMSAHTPICSIREDDGLVWEYGPFRGPRPELKGLRGTARLTQNDVFDIFKQNKATPTSTIIATSSLPEGTLVHLKKPSCNLLPPGREELMKQISRISTKWRPFNALLDEFRTLALTDIKGKYIQGNDAKPLGDDVSRIFIFSSGNSVNRTKFCDTVAINNNAERNFYSRGFAGDTITIEDMLEQAEHAVHSGDISDATTNIHVLVLYVPLDEEEPFEWTVCFDAYYDTTNNVPQRSFLLAAQKKDKKEADILYGETEVGSLLPGEETTCVPMMRLSRRNGKLRVRMNPRDKFTKSSNRAKRAKELLYEDWGNLTGPANVLPPPLPIAIGHLEGLALQKCKLFVHPSGAAVFSVKEEEVQEEQQQQKEEEEEEKHEEWSMDDLLKFVQRDAPTDVLHSAAFKMLGRGSNNNTFSGGDRGALVQEYLDNYEDPELAAEIISRLCDPTTTTTKEEKKKKKKKEVLPPEVLRACFSAVEGNLQLPVDDRSSAPMPLAPPPSSLAEVRRRGKLSMREEANTKKKKMSLLGLCAAKMTITNVVTLKPQPRTYEFVDLLESHARDTSLRYTVEHDLLLPLCPVVTTEEAALAGIVSPEMDLFEAVADRFGGSPRQFFSTWGNVESRRARASVLLVLKHMCTETLPSPAATRFFFAPEDEPIGISNSPADAQWGEVLLELADKFTIKPFRIAAILAVTVFGVVAAERDEKLQQRAIAKRERKEAEKRRLKEMGAVEGIKKWTRDNPGIFGPGPNMTARSLLEAPPVVFATNHSRRTHIGRKRRRKAYQFSKKKTRADDPADKAMRACMGAFALFGAQCSKVNGRDFHVISLETKEIIDIPAIFQGAGGGEEEEEKDDHAPVENEESVRLEDTSVWRALVDDPVATVEKVLGQGDGLKPPRCRGINADMPVFRSVQHFVEIGLRNPLAPVEAVRARWKELKTAPKSHELAHCIICAETVAKADMIDCSVCTSHPCCRRCASQLFAARFKKGNLFSASLPECMLSAGHALEGAEELERQVLGEKGWPENILARARAESPSQCVIVCAECGKLAPFLGAEKPTGGGCGAAGEEEEEEPQEQFFCQPCANEQQLEVLSVEQVVRPLKEVEGQIVLVSPSGYVYVMPRECDASTDPLLRDRGEENCVLCNHCRQLFPSAHAVHEHGKVELKKLQDAGYHELGNHYYLPPVKSDHAYSHLETELPETLVAAIEQNCRKYGGRPGLQNRLIRREL